ncbi:MAG: putative transport system permease protein [Bacillota bacterium]|jgi:putative ABC transport system permease protein|nr:putative transport system permease protein [Bacillota bacterium]
MRVLDRRLWRLVKASKLQFGTVVALVFVGMAAFVSFNNTAISLSYSLERFYQEFAFADLFADFSPVAEDAFRRLGELPGVKAVEARLVIDARVDVGRKLNPTLRLVSITPGQKINRLYVQEGSLPEGREHGLALLAKFAQANGLKVGDKISLIIRGKLFPITVTALVDSPEFIYAVKDAKNIFPDDLNFGVGFVNLPLLQELTGLNGQANNAILLLEPWADPEELREEIEDRFEELGLKSIVTRENQLSHAIVSQELKQLNQQSRLIPAIFLSIAAAVTYFMVTRLVEGDRTAIGMLKAIGYADKEVAGHYLEYALAIGFLGAAGGVAAGLFLGKELTELYSQFFHLPLLAQRLYPPYIVLAVLLPVVFTGATGLIAARKVMSIPPAEAMRPLAPLPGGRSNVEKLAPGLWARLPFTWKLVLRGILRSRRRFALAAAGVALTYAVVFLPFYLLGLWDTIFREQFGRFEKYDYMVSFSVQVSSAAIPEIKGLVRVTAIEPYAEYPFRITHGWREKTVVARALPVSTKLYSFEDSTGKVVRLPRFGVLLSEYLAKELGVEAGDLLTVSSYATKGVKYLVPVKAVVRQYLGSGLYMSLEQLQRLTGLGDAYSGVLLNSPENVKEILQPAANVAAVYSSRDLSDLYAEYGGLLLASITVMVLAGGLLGFGILFNTANISISERIREFSALRVLGFSREEVYGLILRENAMALLLGLIAGVPLGRMLAVWVASSTNSELFYLPLTVRPGTYVVTALLVVLFVALVMGVVWLRVRKVNFLEALSSRLT